MHTHTYTIVRKMSRLTYLGLTFPSTFYSDFHALFRAFAFRSPSMSRWNWNRNWNWFLAAVEHLLGPPGGIPELIRAFISDASGLLSSAREKSLEKGDGKIVCRAFQLNSPHLSLLICSSLLLTTLCPFSRSYNKRFQIVLEIRDYFFSGSRVFFA